MQTKTFLSLELYRNNFANARDGINFLVECAQSNQACMVLNGFLWLNHPIDSMDVAHHLLDGLPSPTSIRLAPGELLQK